jgi:hypothetical protein
MRNAVALDSGPLFAFFNRRQKEHERVVRFFSSPPGPLLTTWPVFTEVTYLLRPMLDAQRGFITWTIDALDIDEESGRDRARIVEIMEKYEGLPADFADASLLAMCERRGIERVATFDSDFSVYRTASRKRLKNVFASQ